MVAVPAVAGMKTPTLLTPPMLDGLTDQLTAPVKLPVPVTDALQADVWLVRIEVGEQDKPTDVIVGGKLTAMLKLSNLELSCVDVAVIVAAPAEAGVKTPVLLMPPIVDGLTDHVTEPMKLPVPVTLEVQVAVWFIRIAAELQEVDTDVIVGN